MKGVERKVKGVERSGSAGCMHHATVYMCESSGIMQQYYGADSVTHKSQGDVCQSFHSSAGSGGRASPAAKGRHDKWLHVAPKEPAGVCVQLPALLALLHTSSNKNSVKHLQ